MKKLYTFLILLAVGSLASVAQNKDTKKADQLYDRLAYVDAASAYQKLLKKGKGGRYVFERLANSYYFINDTKKAETYYRRVIKGKNVKPETVYNYAQALKVNGKWSDFNTQMQRFAEMRPNDSRAMEFRKNPNYIPQIMEQVQRYSASNMEEINTEYSEFGGSTFGKQLYFSSARNTTRRKYQWNEEPFLDIYVADIIADVVKNASLLEGEVNGKFHEGNVAITADGNRMYFDSNDFYKGKFDKSEEGINQINLFYIDKIAGTWKGPRSVHFNTDEYSYGHPALSPNGNILYFASDMPGGKGGSDIYKVAVNKDGSLGTPQRLGDHINTEGKEVFPYMDSAGTLYFSSDGHQGIGGLDVFSSVDGGMGSAANLGIGVNSEADDFAFKYDPTTEMGYVSSNRKGGKGSDDIYRIKKLEPPCDVTMDIVVLNEYTKEPIKGARVDLYDTKDNKLSTKTAGDLGNATVLGACEQPHVVQAFMSGFEPNGVDVEASGNGKLNKTILLRPIEAIIVDDKVVLNPILFDLAKHNIKPQAAFELDKLVAIMKKYPNMVIDVESHTDNRGKDAYNLDLSERRAQSTVQYVISRGIEASRISGKGYGETQPVEDCGANCTDEQYQKNRRSEFIIVKR